MFGKDACFDRKFLCVLWGRLFIRYLTGKCVADANTTSANHCEMAAWCPPEVSKDVLNENKHNLSDTGDFTVFFRVDGSFSELGSNFSTGDDLVYNYNLFYLSDLIAYSQGVDVYPTANLTKHEKLSGRPSNGPFDNVLGSGVSLLLSMAVFPRLGGPMDDTL